jgi:hypothetical protein
MKKVKKPAETPPFDIDGVQAENERLKRELAEIKKTGTAGRDHSLDDTIFIYRCRESRTLVLQPIKWGIESQSDGTIRRTPVPGSKSIKLAFRASENKPGYRARFMLDQEFAESVDSTVADIKKLLEAHSQFRGKDPDIVLVKATKDRAEASAEIPAQKGPKVIVGTRSSGDTG